MAVSRLMMRAAGRTSRSTPSASPQTYAWSTGRGIGPLTRSASSTYSSAEPTYGSWRSGGQERANAWSTTRPVMTSPQRKRVSSPGVSIARWAAASRAPDARGARLLHETWPRRTPRQPPVPPPLRRLLLLLDLELDDVRAPPVVAQEVLHEVLRPQPEPVVAHVAEPVALAGEDEEVEALVRLDQSVDHAERARRMDVVVDVARGQQQAALQVLRQVRVLRDVVLEPDVALVVHHFLHAVVRLGPPAVVHVVVVVPRGGDGDLEEVRVDQHRGRGHEAAARVAVDADALDVDERVPVRELLDRDLLVGQSVVAEVAVPVVVVPLRPGRVAAAVPDRDHDEAELRERGLEPVRVERLRDRLRLRARVDVRDDRVLPVRVEVERL